MSLAISRRQLAALLLFVCAALVLVPDLFWVAFANGKHFDFSRPYAVMSGLVPNLLAILLLFALLARRLWIAMLVLLPFLPLVPVESAYIFHYGEPTWYAVIATAFESNSREIVDFTGYLLWPLIAASVLCLAIGIAAVLCLRRTQLAWEGRSRAMVLAGVLTALGAGLAFYLSLSARQERHASGNSSAGADGVSIASALVSGFPLGVPIRLWRWEQDREDIASYVDGLRSFRFGARALREIGQRQIYVLVIGEASRSDRWQLYGYDRPTNPELAKVPNLIRLADMLTPWSASRMAVPIIVSRKKGIDPRGNFGEKSISEVFSEAGFSTYWMSNQIAFGGYDSPITVVAKDAQHVSFYNVADYSNPGNYDGDLIAPLEAAIASDPKNLFIVLHTLGSHENYALRYPDSFDRFKPSLKDVTHANIDDLAQAQEISNSYDASILYTDHFLAQVIRTLEKTGAVSTMWYVSDHGEDLINDACRLTGHGSGTVYNFRIPSVFWYSDAYAQVFDTTLRTFDRHRLVPATTENVFESLVDMAGLAFPGHDSSWSLFSDAWQPHQRVVNSVYGNVQLDFDRAGQSTNCRMMTLE